MSNLLTSCTTQATSAPGYYNQYLSGLASQGMGAAGAAQFVGATPLQQEAFGQVCGASGAYKPALQQAGGALGTAYGMATKCNPLAAGSPYLQGATSCLGKRTQGLMNPYVNCVVRQIGTLGQMNIQQNLAPGATGAAVGTGQFGSQRGAQVLGQTLANANQQILGQQAAALQCGYKTALCGAIRQGAICAQAGATAGSLAGEGAQNLASIAKTGACMAATCQNLALQRINALESLGTAQQTICQNRQLFPLSVLCKASGLLRGYNVPTSQVTTSSVSPMSGLTALGTGATALFCSKNGPSVFCSIVCETKKLFGGSCSAGAGCGVTTSLGTGFYSPTGYSAGCAPGGVGNVGCAFNCSTLGALNLGFAGGYAEGGLASVPGARGCVSTRYRGARPE